VHSPDIFEYDPDGWNRDPGSVIVPAWLIAFIAVQYAVIMFLFYRHDQPWMAVTYFGYMLGNVGLTMIALGYK
jgi:hypothetical protein